MNSIIAAVDNIEEIVSNLKESLKKEVTASVRAKIENEICISFHHIKLLREAIAKDSRDYKNLLGEVKFLVEGCGGSASVELSEREEFDNRFDLYRGQKGIFVQLSTVEKVSKAKA